MIDTLVPVERKYLLTTVCLKLMRRVYFNVVTTCTLILLHVLAIQYYQSIQRTFGLSVSASTTEAGESTDNMLFPVHVNTNENIQSRNTPDVNNDYQEPMEIVDKATKSPTPEKYPQWRDLQKRINSFANFPPQLRQSHQTLAKAGLFYTGMLVMNAVSSLYFFPLAPPHPSTKWGYKVFALSVRLYPCARACMIKSRLNCLAQG